MELRTMIERVGGLHTRSGLAKRWGVTRQYVAEAAGREDFPEPIPLDGGERQMWTGEDADAWRGRARSDEKGGHD